MPSKITIPNLDNLLERYIAGESENQISKDAGINRWTFRQRLIKAGIVPRNQSQSEASKWSRMDRGQRIHQVNAAHKASIGRKVSFDELCLRAKSREGKIYPRTTSQEELIVGQWLTDAGLNIIHNFAVGPYSCDLGASSITVEIWGGGWHAKTIDVKRTKYILDSGYSTLIINIDRKRFPLSRAVTQYVISLLQETSSDPTGRRQYWMIRGDGELIFKRFNSDNISLIPPFTSGRNSTNGQYQRTPR